MPKMEIIEVRFSNVELSNMDGSKTGEAARPGSRALFINNYPVISAAPGNTCPVQLFKQGNGMFS